MGWRNGVQSLATAAQDRAAPRRRLPAGAPAFFPEGAQLGATRPGPHINGVLDPDRGRCDGGPAPLREEGARELPKLIRGAGGSDGSRRGLALPPRLRPRRPRYISPPHAAQQHCGATQRGMEGSDAPRSRGPLWGSRPGDAAPTPPGQRQKMAFTFISLLLAAILDLVLLLSQNASR